MDISLTRSRIISIVLIGLGVGALLQGIYGFHMLDTEYHHEIDQFTAPNRPPGVPLEHGITEPIHEFDTLSEDTQDVFVKTLQSANNKTVIYEPFTETTGPTEFSYPPEEVPASPDYVRYQGSIYEFTTRKTTALGMWDGLIPGMYLLFSGSFVALGAWNLQRDRS